MPEELLSTERAPFTGQSEATPSMTDEELDPPIDFEAAAFELWIERKNILGIGLGALIAATIIAFLLSPYYTATASFIPPSLGPSSSSGIAQSLSTLGVSGLLGPTKNSSELFIGILKSRTVADRMIDRFDLMKVYHKKKRSLTETSLQKNSTFEAEAKSPIITIRVTDKSPERARDMANAYLEEMQAENGSLALTESSQRRLFFEQQLEKEKDNLADAEVALKQSEESTGLIAPAGQTTAEIQAIAQMRAEIAGRKVELSALRQGATNQNPDIIRVQSEISDLQSQLMQMENGKDKDHVQGISAAQVPGLELEYIRKLREVKYHEALFGIIAKQYEAARLDEANNSPVLQVLDHATTPDMKAGPHRGIIMIAGLFVGLLGGSLWVLLQARLRKGPN